MVFATMVICIVSFMVWLHHFFTMGAGANINAMFGIASMIIGIPTGVKIYNWLFTMYGGRVRFTVPIYYLLGFMLTFVGGGLTGVLLAIPPVDFIVHNSLFLVAHFHHVIIGGVVFALMAGYTYWFPKAFGFMLRRRLGKAVFWCWFIGFHLAFMPLYLLGFWGGTRRHAAHFRSDLGAMAARRAAWRGDHRRGDRADGRSALLLDQDARPADATSPATRGTAGPWSG